MTIFYKDSYGCTAKIVIGKDGKAWLTMSTPSGKRFHSREYKTKHGAKVALGRLGDSFREVKR